MENNMSETTLKKDASLLDKARVFGLNEEDTKKIVERFFATLLVSTYDELVQMKKDLQKYGIEKITPAHIKIEANTPQDLRYKLDLMDNSGEIDLYRKDPDKINYNITSILKKVNYCKNNHKPYKDADGKYMDFLFREDSFGAMADRETPVIEPTPIPFEPEVPVISESTYETKVPDITMSITEQLGDALKDIQPIDTMDEVKPSIEMSSYPSAMDSDLQKIEDTKTSFTELEEDMKNQLAGLSYDVDSDYDLSSPLGGIGIYDIQPDSFNTGFSRTRGINDGETRRDDAA